MFTTFNQPLVETKLPRFSIITVCWNAQDTIYETGNSLAQQTLDNYEWLVVDGASTDSTLKEAERVSISNKHVVSQPDTGIYDAMNKAVQLAKGEWLYFLNAGDKFYDNNVLQDINNFLVINPESQLIFGNANYRGDKTDFVKRFSHTNKFMLVFEDLNHQASFAKRTLFQEVGDFKLNFRYSADYDWFIRVFKSGARTIYINRTICIFLIGGAHTTNLAKLDEERRNLRLQYVSRATLWLGGRLANMRRRYFSWRDKQSSFLEKSL